MLIISENSIIPSKLPKSVSYSDVFKLNIVVYKN